MHYISAALFALSANMDNVAIGLAYGIKGVRIRFRSNLLIACLTSLGTFISMAAGAKVTSLLPDRFAANMGCGILILMGFWFIVKSLHNRICTAASAAESASFIIPEKDAPDETAVADTAGKKTEKKVEAAVSFRETFILALALMINNLGFGVGAKIAGLPIVATSVCTFFCSLVLLSGGVFLGKHFSDTFFGRYTDLISGCMIIALGVYEFFI